MRATCGKRGQAFLKDLLLALDSLPEKKLIADELEYQGEYCAIGALARMRSMDVSRIDPEDTCLLAQKFNIPDALCQEVVFMNDEAWGAQTPEERWKTMRAWVVEQIIPPQVSPTEPKI